MSLWSLPIRDITFSDVEEFCLLRISEGPNLDYKQEVPNDLAKVVSSFANTTGGIIIFGVATDGDSRPNWPPAGIADPRGFTEQVTQICRDGIYLPILPDIGNLLESPADPALHVVVVRVHQSPTAPHSIVNKTRVYIRTGSVSTPIDLANIERIEWMLNERRRFSSKHDEFVQLNHKRMTLFMPADMNRVPVAWWCVSPVYPWRPICTPSKCFAANMGFVLHRAPNGAYGFDREHLGNSGQKRGILVALDAFGHIFRGQALSTATDTAPDDLHMAVLIQISREFFGLAQRFYAETEVEHPGYIRMSIGLENVAGAQMKSMERVAFTFPDSQFSVSEMVDYEEFRDADFGCWDAPAPLRRMLDAIAHGFDVPPHYWRFNER
jgi:hypothetical protein